MRKLFKRDKGITLISLVVTIIVLIILAGIGINLILGYNGIVKKAQTAASDTKKETAKEVMNLKITTAQIDSYGKEQRMPTLQELANIFCEDEDFEYVELTTKKQASLNKIVVGNNNSIFTKLKEYPYEFEINSSLQLASIDGIKVATNNENTVSREEYNALLARVENLENKNQIGEIYTETFSKVNIEKDKSNIVKSITLPAGKYVLVGYAGYIGDDLRYYIALGGVSSSAYDKNGYVAMNISSIVETKEEKSYDFTIWTTNKDITVSGFIKAIKIGN